MHVKRIRIINIEFIVRKQTIIRIHGSVGTHWMPIIALNYYQQLTLESTTTLYSMDAPSTPITPQ